MHHKKVLTNDSSWGTDSDEDIEEICRDMNNVNKDINRLTQIIRKLPSYDSYMERSESYLKLDDYESALNDICEAIAIYPTSEAYFKKGNIHMMDEEYKLATHDYDEAVKIDDNIDAYFNRATAHIFLGEPEQALETYWATLKNKSINSYDGEERKKAFIFAINLANSLKKYDKAREFIRFLSLYASDEEEEKQLKVHLELVNTVEYLDGSNVKKGKELKEKEKEMLSFFTHTMRNALATAPESLRQAIRLLGSEDYEKNQKHYEAINEITSLFSTLSLTDCLIDTFKQSIYDTEEFKRAWQNDIAGEATPQWFIAAALRQSLNRIIFMSNTRDLRKLLHDDPALIKPTRKAFIDQVLPLDIDQQGVESFYHWINSLSAIEVSIEENTLQFGVNQIKFSLLFSITSELILNALKYWSGTGQIQIRWYTEQDYYIFTVKNACKKNASSNLAGTHKGLAFIERLMELLDDKTIKTHSPAQFKCYPEEHTFTAELKLHKTLLENDS